MTDRIYRTDSTLTAQQTKVKQSRLIRSDSKSKAFHFVADSLVSVRVATQDDMVELLSEGVKVEEA